MAAEAGPDFAAMLDELLDEKAAEAHAARTASLDYLSVVEELHSGRIHVGDAAAREAYGSHAQAFEAPASPDTGPSDPQPCVEPEAIARELGLRGLRARLPKNLDRLRRDFARRNHPDRVPEHQRIQAMMRMQIANRLIDEAKYKRSGRRRP